MKSSIAKILSLVMVWVVLSTTGQSSLALEPEQQFAWAWTLEPERDERIWRVPLSIDVMEDLHQSGADDLYLVDARGQPVPFGRLADNLLNEPLEEVQALETEFAIIGEDRESADELELILHHEGTRLSIRSPATERRIDRYGELVFEALIGAPAALPHLTGHRLELELGSPTPINLDCRLRAADDDGPAHQRIEFREIGDSRPRRYRGRIQMEYPPEAWHLACYGNRVPVGLELVEAEFISAGQRNHRRYNSVMPQAERNEEERNILEFELTGPFLARAVELRSGEPNLVSRIEVFSRNDPDRNWTRRGAFSLSTLDERESRLEFAGNTTRRDRLWRLVTDPVLDQMPEIIMEVWQDELVFLARGESPWQLYAGSRQSTENIDAANWLTQSVEQLGPAWNWPEISPSGRTEAGGPEVLDIPPPPLPWQRYLLWMVLILGAGLVVFLAIKVLNKA